MHALALRRARPSSPTHPFRPRGSGHARVQGSLLTCSLTARRHRSIPEALASCASSGDTVGGVAVA
eukprot:8181019-Pyramimonas_sp.AAC.1